MEKRFGSVIHHYSPLFSLPLSSEHTAQWPKKVAMCLRIFLPWALVGYFVDYARCTQTCTGEFMGLLTTQPWHNWLGIIWMIPYLYLIVVLLVARTEKSLLQKAIAGILATVVGMYVYIVLPAFGIPLSNTTWNWTIVSLVFVILAMNYRSIWTILLRISEWIANSRHDWLFADGHFRIINHSLYSGLGGAIAVGILSYVIGNPFAALVLLACGLVGAAVFAQVLWGNNMLARPYGYWGAVIGGGVGGLVVTFVFGSLHNYRIGCSTLRSLCSSHWKTSLSSTRMLSWHSHYQRSGYPNMAKSIKSRGHFRFERAIHSRYPIIFNSLQYTVGFPTLEPLVVTGCEQVLYHRIIFHFDRN